ncbi:MAG: GHKL domain-containing protein [Bacteroidetes bacterium]|nr:GHKL domain-containing protein [Bacteroidota bacterium]
MIFKNFRIKIVFRVIILGIMIFLFILSLNQEKWYVTSAVSFSLIIILLIELIYFVESTNREIGKFLLAIKHKDFSSTYADSGQGSTSFSELKQALREITREFQNVRIEKELHYQYLLTVFEHSKSAIICYSETGNIELVNQATKNLLKFNKLTSIDELKRIDVNLFQAIKEIKGDCEEIIKVSINNQITTLNLHCSVFKLKEIIYKMVSLHNLGDVLDNQEIESWQKLIRILNHEIMNSVTPISSLSEAINKMLLTKDGKRRTINNVSATEAEDIYDSLETIESRSKGLLKFVTTYKQLSKLPKPRLSQVNINGLINHIATLMKPELQKQKINIRIPNITQEVSVNIDSEMIEQVLINLLLNAIEAIKNNDTKQIEFNTSKTGNSVFVSVSDNGYGIKSEVLDQIFIPFFTTKKEGSGIGLSLSRQIMLMHKGSISVQSKLGSGTTFILKF